MDIALHMVNIYVVNHQFAEFAADEFFSGIINRVPDIDAFDLLPRYQAFAHFHPWQGKGGFKQFCINCCCGSSPSPFCRKKLPRSALAKRSFPSSIRTLKIYFRIHSETRVKKRETG